MLQLYAKLQRSTIDYNCSCTILVSEQIIRTNEGLINEVEGTIEKVAKAFDLARAWYSRTKTAKGHQLENLLVVLDRKLDKRFYKPKACNKTIICECNRRSCPYRPLSVTVYIRKLKNA